MGASSDLWAQGNGNDPYSWSFVLLHKSDYADGSGKASRSSKRMGRTMTKAAMKALNAIADVVLAYRPKPKSEAAKKRKRKAKKKKAAKK